MNGGDWGNMGSNAACAPVPLDFKYLSDRIFSGLNVTLPLLQASQHRQTCRGHGLTVPLLFLIRQMNVNPNFREFFAQYSLGVLQDQFPTFPTRHAPQNEQMSEIVKLRVMR